MTYRIILVYSNLGLMFVVLAALSIGYDDTALKVIVKCLEHPRRQHYNKLSGYKKVVR